MLWPSIYTAGRSRDSLAPASPWIIWTEALSGWGTSATQTFITLVSHALLEDHKMQLMAHVFVLVQIMFSTFL